MQTITFYSFKGGVGRTMALVNSAMELAKQGRVVFLIDFDLEAPGLTTFDRLRPNRPHQGVVEYVSEYIRTGVSPDVRDYVYKVNKEPDVVGDIYVMPSGAEDDEYRGLLATIDWLDLYKNKDGFVFFEDMKSQLQAFANPDYLLVDSRTGHSDVEGICTRHLPDSVVVVFFPNEQNLTGLEGVCRSIRREKELGLNKEIDMHFVMSNVPDLDDEDEILRARLRSFRIKLQFDRLAVRIHHYNSLSLLNQSIFVLDRPRSRLAKEYRKLVEILVKSNPGDREGVLRYLDEVVGGNRTSWTSERLSEIDETFPEDAEIQVALAKAKYSEGRFSEALTNANRAISFGEQNWQAVFQRALILDQLDESDRAMEDLGRCLHSQDIDSTHTLRAFRVAIKINPKYAETALDTPAVRRLDWGAKFEIAGDLTRDDQNWKLSIPLLTDIWENGNVRHSLRWPVRHFLSLSLIRAGFWDDAVALLSGSLRNLEQSSILTDAFNLAMAYWGKTKNPVLEFFQTAYEAALPISNHGSANFYQCMSLVFWVVGYRGEAAKLLSQAISIASDDFAERFSCWRYANTNPIEFLDDCREIEQFMSGLDVTPLFIRIVEDL